MHEHIKKLKETIEGKDHFKALAESGIKFSTLGKTFQSNSEDSASGSLQ
jgi:hypothetical protein